MKIIGNTVGTTLPKPNLDQTDPTKGDYIKGDRSNVKGTKGDKGDKGDSVTVKSWGRSDLFNTGDMFTYVILTDGKEDYNVYARDGKNGETPEKGVDYYTEEEKTELVEEVLDSLNKVSAIDFTNFSSGSFTEVVDGETVTHPVTFDESGNPKTIDGISLTFPA